MDKRVFVKKKPGFQVEAESLAEELRTSLNLGPDFSLEQYNLYDLFGVTEEDVRKLEDHILAESYTDIVETPDLEGKMLLAHEYLPGQYDQRADSAMQCLALLDGSPEAVIRSGTLLVLKNCSEKEREKIAAYVINPVESRRKDLSVLVNEQDVQVAPVPVLEGFVQMNADQRGALLSSLGLAMSPEDLAFVQAHFRDVEKRNPTMTELRVLDTYWSDHCRHTTFETILENVQVAPGKLQETLQASLDRYMDLRTQVHQNRKPRTLMDMATIAGKAIRRQGGLEDLEISDEINACSIEVQADVNGQREPWLLMFKNETHNHPTEIEPFGGAATCIGGAIRDPLSGRSYVYQAMRITGAGDITKPVSETLEHKLPQSKISKTAAKGYSSYGNQIGLATTFVEEVYDEGFTAKRMEVGAVAGAAPKAHVRRDKPAPGDLVVLIGGATGRDGIGGATGSSKEHNETSLEKCSSEVQKGNALTERKLQRLFRNPEATLRIKKANDFGAGGVSVAIGELAEGLDIDLDAVPVKYEGLDGTELAISESQERMACVIAPEDLEAFAQACASENLDCTVTAVVTESPRLVMRWNGQTIVDMPRSFLDTNGVRGHQDVVITDSEYAADPFRARTESWKEVLSSPNVACQQGLAEMFDASIGKSTVLMPFGGRNQLTPEEGSVQKLPVDGFTHTASVMTYGYHPETAEYSPYLGAAYSVVLALARQAALGADALSCRLSNQEYFERLGKDPEKWGQPMQALLGLVDAQLAFGTPAIGGKDSMSGTYKHLHVPPTVITFAVSVMNDEEVISAALKEKGHPLYVLRHVPKADKSPDYEQLKANFQAIREYRDKITAAKSVQEGGIGAAVFKMAFGNGIGAEIAVPDLYDWNLGSLVVEASEEICDPRFERIGSTADQLVFNGETIELDKALGAWTSRHDRLYPRFVKGNGQLADTPLAQGEEQYSAVRVEKPVVVIPVFPGQNCELDLAAQFARAGGEVRQVVFNNQFADQLHESIQRLAKEIAGAQILMLAGGFSSGDEPDGSGKFIANVLQNEQIAQAIETMRANDGLILGICNGFQALVKSGLLPDCTLFRNDINRHVSRMVTTRVSSTRSPWLMDFVPGQEHVVAVSHGEGKFMADEQVLEQLAANGQIAFQYVDEEGKPSMDGRYNPNGSLYAIEGILSGDGRILGKMGHSERWEPGLFQNIPGDADQNLFRAGIRFFTHEGRK